MARKQSYGEKGVPFLKENQLYELGRFHPHACFPEGTGLRIRKITKICWLVVEPLIPKNASQYGTIIPDWGMCSKSAVPIYLLCSLDQGSTTVEHPS